MSRTIGSALFLVWACNGNKDESDIIPLDDADADADSDTDSDADTDTDSDADTDTGTAALCVPYAIPAEVVIVDANTDLAAAIAGASPGDTLALADGTYTVTGPIALDKPLTLVSQSGNRDAVIIDGARQGTHLFEITASSVVLAHLTLTGSYDHLIHVVPADASLSGLRLHDLHLVDPGRYAVKVERDDVNLRYVDDGELSCSLVELTPDGQGFIREQCNTGGIDAEGVRGWTVRDSLFRNFYCNIGTAGPAVRFYRGAREIEVTRNQVLDAAIGIVMGETQDQIGRVYDDDPCGDRVLQAIDGTVTNNIVAAFDEDIVDSDGGIVTGIRAESSCNVFVAHNSVYAGATPESSIEHRYETTTGAFANNLMSHVIRRLNDSTAANDVNVENVPFDTWYYPAGDDFHTAPGADRAIDVGSTSYLDRVPVDIDGEPRDGTPDVGADEQPPGTP